MQGSVADYEGGQPLEKVSVTLHKLDRPKGSPKRTTTDTGGRFTFETLLPGRYRASAERDGFVRSEPGARSPGAQGPDIELRDHEHLQNVAIRLLRHSILQGRVTDLEQRPIANAKVQAVRETHRGGRRQFVTGGTGVTGKEGRYIIPGLAPGRYYLYATPRHPNVKLAGSVEPPTVAEPHYVPAYYPGALDAAGAIPVDITPGMELRDVDLTLRRGDTARITGTIAEGFSDAVGEGTTIYLMPADNSDMAGVARRTVSVREGQGTFQIDAVRPGSYILMAERFDSDVRYVAKEQVGVGRSDIQVNVQMSQTPPVHGRILLEPEGTAIQSEGLAVEFETADPSPLRVLGGKVLADGTFTVEHVPPGTITVRVPQAPSGFYVKSVRYGGVESPDLSVQIANGATAAIEVTLSASGGSISGSVLDSKQQPIEDANILLIPDEEHRSQSHLYRKAKANANGSFDISGIAPGRYSIFALQESDDLPYFDPAFLRRVERSLVSVAVTAKQTRTVQLRLAEIQ